MTTLGDIQTNNFVLIMMSILFTATLYVLYCAVRKNTINLKLLVFFIVVVCAVVIPVQNYYYNHAESDVIHKFNSGNDIICRFNKNSNIVISQKRGYRLKSRFLIKDEMAIKLSSCYLLK